MTDVAINRDRVTDRRGTVITGLRWLGSRKKFRGKAEPVEVMTYAQAREQVAHAEELVLRAIPPQLLKLRDAARSQARRIENAEDLLFFEMVLTPPKRKRKGNGD